MMHISLFSGIGGFELAAEWSGWQNIASCEINEFGRKVLEHYWPDVYHHDDIHTFTYERLNDELTRRYGADWRSDDIILTGGFPCQPYSAAGKRQGKEDDRHLWPQMLRVIREVRPKWVVGENVLGLVNWNRGLVFDEVQADLEAEGYEVQPYVLPAASVGAPHRRDRVWFVAYAKGIGNRGKLRGLEKSNDCKWQPKEYREDNLQYRNNGSIGNATNTNIGTTESSRTGRGTQEGGSNNDIQPSQRGETSELNTRSYTLSPNATNTESNGCNKQRQKTNERKKYQLCDGNTIRNITTTNGNKWDATDTNSRRQPCKEHGQTESGHSAKTGSSNYWQNFPTQSPICGGDDGLPSQLDGITFPKWRNESIKAYGNAIVPQVVYQIFLAIQHYEDQQ